MDVLQTDMEQPKLSNKIKARSLQDARRLDTIEKRFDRACISKDSMDISAKNVVNNNTVDLLSAVEVSSTCGTNGLSVAELNSVVKVFSTHRKPCYGRPWKMAEQITSTGSSFVISNHRLLTNARVVDFASVICVQRRFEDTKYVAKALAVAEDCDLAILTVEDDEFWEGLYPLKFGSFPKLQDNVTVVGYSCGGKNLSTTNGVVSRIDLHWYSYGHQFITVQIDAAINYGNSGGPVFNKCGHVVGVAFQKIDFTNSGAFGYIIGNNVVNRFINDIEKHGFYTGYPVAGICYQKLEDIDFRRYLKMKNSQSGVFITFLKPRTAARKVLKKGDILTKVDGVDVSNSGTVSHASGERVDFQAIISDKHVGDAIIVSIIRDGNEMEVSYPASGHQSALFPLLSWQRLPEYLIIGGLVFTVYTFPYLINGYCKNWKQKIPNDFLTITKPTYNDDVDEIVIICHVLKTELNIHYADIENYRLIELNGDKVRSLRHLNQLLKVSTEEFLHFYFAELINIVSDREKALSADKELSEKFQIPSLCRFNDPAP